MTVNKVELFDVDAMDGLLRHEGIPKDVKMQLKRYKKRRINGNQVQIQYDFPKGFTVIKKGRIYPSPYLGISIFRSDVAAALAQKYYDMLDVKNCQPVLLAQIAKKENVACPALEQYVVNRSAIRSAIEEKHKLTPDESKLICIIVLFGGFIKLHPLLPLIHAELKELSRTIINKYPEFLKMAQISAEKKTDDAIKFDYKKDLTSAALAHYVQNEERSVLFAMDAWFQENSYSSDILQHDGCFVRKINGVPFPTSRLEELEGAVLTNTKYSVKIDAKALEHTLDFSSASGSGFIAPNIYITDSWAAEQFYNMAKDKLLKHNDTLWGFDEDEGIWKPSVDHLVHHYRAALIWKQMGDMGVKTTDYGGTVRNTTPMLKKLLQFVEEKPLSAVSSIGKLLFKNGIYNFDTREFVEEFNPNTIFLGRINRDFSSTRNAVIEAEIHKIFFEDPYLDDQKEQGLFYKTALARAIYGDYRAKRCYITVGRANCGRGLLTEALSLTFGSFVDIFEANALLFNSHSSEDSAKKNAWLVPLVNKRMCISNEIELTGRFIDSNRLKTLCGGGDDIKARQNYVNDTRYSVLSTFFLLANDIPAIKPADEGLMNRMCVNELRKTYTSTPTPGRSDEVLEDKTLKDKFADPVWLDAFFWVLADAWTEFARTNRLAPKPAGMVADAQEWIEVGTSIKSLLEQGFTITKNEGDFVLSSQVLSFLKARGCKDSETKIGREVSRLTGFPAFTKKVNGATKQVKLGLKRIEEDDTNTLE